MKTRSRRASGTKPPSLTLPEVEALSDADLSILVGVSITKVHKDLLRWPAPTDPETRQAIDWAMPHYAIDANAAMTLLPTRWYAHGLSSGRVEVSLFRGDEDETAYVRSKTFARAACIAALMAAGVVKSS